MPYVGLMSAVETFGRGWSCLSMPCLGQEHLGGDVAVVAMRGAQPGMAMSRAVHTALGPCNHHIDVWEAVYSKLMMLDWLWGP
jgi:hypothetical protein